MASVAVPLSLVSFIASSFFFCAAICHAGIAARPPDLLYNDAAGFSVDGVDAAGVVLPCAPVELAPLVPFDCSTGAGVATGCCAGVELPEVPLTFGVGAGLCDWFAP